MREATEMKEKDLNRVNLALRAYAAVGYGFDELADEYGTLMRDMENKEWALDELAKSNWMWMRRCNQTECECGSVIKLSVNAALESNGVNAVV